MANQDTKRIGKRPATKPVSKMDTLQDTWTVMKPFVHFSIKAMRVLAHALIFVVKNIPKPSDNHKTTRKSDEVIKI